MFPEGFLSSLRAKRNVSPGGKQVFILASYLDKELSFVQVTVKQRGSDTMHVTSVLSDSHQNSLLKAIETTDDVEVKAYLRTALCDLLD